MSFFDYFFPVNIKKEKQFKRKKMHKIESIQTGEKNIRTFSCPGQGLNQGPPGSYSSVLTTTLTML